MSLGILPIITNTAKTIFDIQNNRKKLQYENQQRKFENQLALKDYDLKNQNFYEKQRSRANARQAFDKSSDHLSNLKTYELSDLYKKVNVGKGKDQLNRYRVGPELKQNLVTDTAFNNLVNNPLIQRTQRQNINLLREIRDKGSSAVDKNQLQNILHTQRQENKSNQDTLTRRAIEQGLNPHRARFTQRLLSAQSTANRNNKFFNTLASDASNRRLSATQNLQNVLQNAFNQSSQIASAQDNQKFKNTDIRNQQNLINYQQAKTTRDKNTQLQNENLLKNIQNYTQANKAVLDSHNKKQQQQAQQYANKGQSLFKY